MSDLPNIDTSGLPEFLVDPPEDATPPPPGPIVGSTAANFRILPSVREVSQPFRINPNGAVASDLDPFMWARNHLVALLLTGPGERVMRPNYGAGVRNFVFENNDPFVESTMLANIQASVAQYEPNIVIKQLNIVPQPPDYSIFEFLIVFTVGISATPQTVSFSVGGTGVEVAAK